MELKFESRVVNLERLMGGVPFGQPGYSERGFFLVNGEGWRFVRHFYRFQPLTRR